MLVLVGFMGSGKTTVGRLLAARLGMPFIDSDRVIEQRSGSTIAEIFERDGELGFRDLEREVVFELLEGRDAVLALGGGAVVDPAVCARLRQAETVYLKVPLGEALKRADGSTRPMLGRRDPATLLSEREPLYRSVAGYTVDTSGRPPQEVAVEIATRLGRNGSTDDVRIITVAVPDRAYSVVVGRGIAERFTEWIDVGEALRAFVVTHPSLTEMADPLFETLARSGLETVVLTIPEGEASKSLAVAADLCTRLAAGQAHRRDLLVTFGGGVVSDVGGFAGSIYMRGMSLVHVPTTLLGQVDAAIGGKTGVNLPEGKNQLGTIYQPRLVVCDVDLLKTCPAEEIASGLAEVAKAGLIAGPDLLEVIVGNSDEIHDPASPVMEELVARAVAIKASIVASDEKEAGDRAFLNYGHTFGHAIETLTGIRHGEAVAIGMMAAALTAAELGRISEEAVQLHRDVLDACRLPLGAELELQALKEAWKHDKKYLKGVRFVLLMEPGKPEAGIEVLDPVLERALDRLGREEEGGRVEEGGEEAR